jgi:hypothetical protein
MGREVRMVKSGWSHPKTEQGVYIPLLGWSFEEEDKEWSEEYAKWQEGLVSDYEGGWKPMDASLAGLRYTDYSGDRPSPDNYMPQWSEGEAILFVMYENTSEGTPISPAFETPEELARWLADTGASSFGDSTATYEQWLYVCKGGFAPSAVIENGVLMSGVEVMGNDVLQEKENTK